MLHSLFEENKRALRYPEPSMHIWLYCDPEEALRRANERGREEEKGLQLSYLKELDNKLSNWMHEISNNGEHIVTIEALIATLRSKPSFERHTVLDSVKVLKIDVTSIKPVEVADQLNELMSLVLKRRMAETGRGKEKEISSSPK